MDNDTRNGSNLRPALPASSPRRRPGIKSTVQAASLQRFAFDAAQALRASLCASGVLVVTREDAQALAQIVRAWDIAADRLRVLRGRGLPASERGRARRSPAGVEPLEPA